MTGVLTTHRLTQATFHELCAGPVTGDTLSLLDSSQHSHRRLLLRALLDQLAANPRAVGAGTEPERAWRVLAEADRLDPAAVAEILMYPTVGVWLARALHNTRPGEAAPWPELGYLHLVAAAAAVRSGWTGAVRVPVWHGIVSLPTVGQVRVPGAFPVGSVDVVCAGAAAEVRVNPAVTVRLDGTHPAFSPAQRQERTSRGLTLRTWLEAADPYHGFGEPRSPTDLAPDEFAEWTKLIGEAWDVLTLDHPAHAAELAAGLRSLGPIEPAEETVGSSASAAFGAIRVSAGGSATELAEAIVHEMQHSKLNALLGLVRLTEDDHDGWYLAPWRDDPRPLVGLVHGVYAFTCGVEFWLAQELTTHGSDPLQVAFTIAHRRAQVRAALDTLRDRGRLTRPGTALVDTVSARLAVCEQAPVSATLTSTVTTMLDDHRALWRLLYVRPDATSVTATARAWLDGAPPPECADGETVPTETRRRLPANRRDLLRARATEPALFAELVGDPTTLPGTTPAADAALCRDDHTAAATAYTNRLRANPNDGQAWIGLGLALRGQGRPATALLDHPELTIAVHREVRALRGPAPDPVALSLWLSTSRLGTPR